MAKEPIAKAIDLVSKGFVKRGIGKIIAKVSYDTSINLFATTIVTAVKAPLLILDK